MSEQSATAHRYREYAEELRAVAGDYVARKHRTALMRIAANCEHMAKVMEAIERSNKAVGTSGTPGGRRVKFWW